MKLLGSLTSPYVRKTRIVLAEKKIDCEFVVDNGGQDGYGLADHNPLCRIPVLLLDDGTSLFDSRVIVEYLDNLAPNNRLIPPPAANASSSSAGKHWPMASSMLPWRPSWKVVARPSNRTRT